MSKSLPGIILVGFIILAVGAASLLVMQGERREKAVVEMLKAAETSLQEGEVSKTISQYEKVLEKDSGNVTALFGLFDLVAFFDREKGAAYLDQIKPAGADREGHLYRRIRLALMEEDKETADTLMEELREVNASGMESQIAQLMLMIAGNQLEEGMALLVELNGAYPSNRLLNWTTASVLAGQENSLNRIQAKDKMLRLLDREDEFSFKAATYMLLTNGLPLFQEDLVTVADHLENHPYLDAGFEQLQIESARAVTSRIIAIRPSLATRLATLMRDRKEARAEDMMLWLYANQQAGEHEAIQDQVDKLAAKASPSIPEQLLIARQQVLSGEMDSAARLLQQVLQKDPANLPALELALGVVFQPNADLDNSIRMELAELALGNSVLNNSIFLQTAGLLLAGATDRKEEILDKVIGRLGESDAFMLYRWLNDQKEHSRVLAMISIDEAKSDVSTFSVYCDALIGMERVEEVRQLLQNSAGLLEPWRKNLYQARVELLQERTESFRSTIRKAVEEMPASERSNLFVVANLAKQGDLEDIQNEALTLAYDAGLAFPQQLAMDYLGLLLDSRSLEKSLNFASYCHNLQPQNPVYINNLSYLRIISGRGIGPAIEAMRALVERYPETDFFLLTLALGELVGGYPGQARETLESIPSAEGELEMRSKLIHALVLSGTGDRQRGSSMFESIDVNLLMDQERALINRFYRDGSF